MSIPILTTKLYIPRPRPDGIPRVHLIERLNAGQHRKLTLVSAAAGFGKTTLISEWIAGGQRPAAWLSLDEADSDPTRFLTYLVAALQTLGQSGAGETASKLGEEAMALLQSPQPPSAESILTMLINEIAALPSPTTLVLDDYHVIDATAVDDALIFLIEHLPPQMHLVLTSREDPPLPLARYRARGQLTELRANDLRFTPDEAADFFNQAMGLSLSTEEVVALEARTEGWIAGLQLAALSIQGREDTAAFVQAFAGSHSFILDYLVEEVLQRQPDPLRNFLLQTSILGRLCGSLCAAVTVQEDGHELLAALERGNLFVIPLDDQRQWYRYHHLFADVLKTYLLEEQPDLAPILHLRASAWYERNDLPEDAIGHALAAQAFERAADLIELIWPAMDGGFRADPWLAWARDLPDDLVRARPVLCVAYAWALLNGGDVQAAESRLRDAERRLDGDPDDDGRQDAPAGEMTVVDQEQYDTLPASIATARAYIAQTVGDLPGSVVHAQRALDLLPEDDYVRRGPAAALLGLAYWQRGDLEAAYRALADAMTGFQMAGSIAFAISGTYGLADIRIAQGRLHAAVHIYEQALQLVAEQGGTMVRGTADLYFGLSELRREQGDAQAASQYLQRSEALGEQAALADWPYRLRLTQAKIRESQGDLDSAIDLLDEAERLYYPTPVPNLRPVAALRARVWIKQGRLVEALDWVREQGLSVDNDLSYLREFEHITLASVLIVQYRNTGADRTINDALGLLARLLTAAEAGDRTGSVIEILVTQALAHQEQGDTPRALDSLERALTLAEPEGYVRVFVDEGQPMADLLRAAAKEGIAPAYVRHLRAAFGETVETASIREPVAQPLVEPLSERELEVLRLLRSDLNGPEIARELTISLNTLRTHTKNIYSKLDVTSRRAAVRRAEELDLV